MAVEYVKWDDSRVEYKDENEDKDITAVANVSFVEGEQDLWIFVPLAWRLDLTWQLINGAQKGVFESHGHAWGGTHVKTHGVGKSRGDLAP